MSMAKKPLHKKNTIREHKKVRKGISMGNMMPKVKVSKAISGNVRSLLDGSFLTKDKFLAQAPFFFYVFGFAFIYIALNFYADKTLLSIERTKEEIKELRFEFVTLSSEVIQFTQASNVAELLKEHGVKRPITPPSKIIISNSEKSKK